MDIPQQTFLGASLRGFNASIGWGGNSSSVDINLVEDDKNVRPGFPHGDVFTPLDVGQPATFVVSGYNPENSQYSYWDYTGLIKNYKADVSPNGNPLYSVSMMDPRELLEGSKIILGNYYGSVSGFPNMFNVYGYMEDLLGLNNPSNPNYSNNFGGSEANDAGIPYRNIVRALGIITSGNSSRHYGERIQLKDRYYTLNLSNLPRLADDYRIPNVDSMSCIDFISDICNTANHDFFVELQPVYYKNNFNEWVPSGDYNGKQIHEINVVTIDRSSIPQSGVISKFITAVSGASVKNIGFEFRNGTVGKFLTGGNLSLMYYKKDDTLIESGLSNTIVDLSKDDHDYMLDGIHQFWGLDEQENLIQQTPRVSDNTDFTKFKAIGRVRDSAGNFIIKDKQPNVPTIRYRYEEYDRSLRDFPGTAEVLYLNPQCHTSDISGYMPQIFQTINIDTRMIPEEIWDLGVYETSEGELRAVSSSIEAWQMYLASMAGYEYIPIMLEDWHYLDKTGHTIYEANFHIYEPKTQTMIPATRLINRALGPIPGNVQFLRYKTTGIKNPAFGRYYNLSMNGGFGNGENAQKVFFNVFNNRFNTYEDTQKHVQQLATNLDKLNLDVTAYNAALLKKLYDHLYEFAENYGKRYTVDVPEILATSEKIPGEKYRIRSNITPAQYGYLSSGQIASGVALGFLPESYVKLMNEEGQISAYMKVEDAYLYNLEQFNQSDIVYEYFQNNGLQIPKNAFIKIKVDENIYFVDKATALKPKVLIELPSILGFKEELKAGHFGACKNAVDQLQYFNKGSDRRFAYDDANTGADTMYEYIAPVAFKPRFVMIPFSSNTESYGPWWKIGANGAIEYEKDENLVPWKFNGYEGMNLTALAKVAEVAESQFDEYGTVEIPSIPAINLGRQLKYVNTQNNQYVYGPYITDISVDFSEAGFKTTYKMQTWTPSFGKVSKYFSDKVQRLTTDAFKDQQRILTKTSEGFSKSKEKDYPSPLKTYKKHSSASIIAGENYGELKSGEVAFVSHVVIQPDYNTVSQQSSGNFNQAAISLDGLFRPYSTNFHYSNGKMGHFEIPNSGFREFQRGRRQGLYEWHPFPSGHDVQVVSHANGMLVDSENPPENTDYRGIAFKVPGMVLTGYGIAVGGTPVPNASGYEYDESGVYTVRTSGWNETSEFYATGYMTRPDMWKTGPLAGPVWEPTEKCWFFGTRLYEGYLIEDLPHTSGRLSDLAYTQARMVLVDGTYAGADSGVLRDDFKLWNRADASGVNIAEQKKGKVYDQYKLPRESGGIPELFVLLTNRSTRIDAPSGAYVIAANMPNGELRPIWIDCESEETDGIL